MGTVLALEVSSQQSGYASTAAQGIIGKLKLQSIYVRPLGNVVYVMCSPITPRTSCQSVLETLIATVSECSKSIDLQVSRL
eukprot:g38051.t1